MYSATALGCCVLLFHFLKNGLCAQYPGPSPEQEGFASPFRKRLLGSDSLKLANLTTTDYESILHQARDLASSFPDIVHLNFAEDIYNLGNVLHSYQCGYLKCKIPILHVANHTTVAQTTPEVFFSGALHGNERIGPAVALEFAKFLASHYDESSEVKYIVNNRSIHIMPFPNAWGFYNDERAEGPVDPNRDFPYNSAPDSCMKSFAARAVNEVFRHHIFRIAVTFHGGTRMISYEWGAYNHVTSLGDFPRYTSHAYRSTEAPDATSQNAIATMLQQSAGLRASDSSPDDWFYPIGDASYTVYPVNGGMEDWAYAASWDSSQGANHTCETEKMGYPVTRTIYDSSSLRCSTFLVETDDLKAPEASTYGSSDALITGDSTKDGHVPRNIRLAFMATELAQPGVIFKKKLQDTYRKGKQETISFNAVGCQELSAAEFVILRGYCPVLLNNEAELAALSSLSLRENSEDQMRLMSREKQTFLREHSSIVSRHPFVPSSPDKLSCHKLGKWDNNSEDNDATGHFSISVDLPTTEDDYCGILVVKFDQHWRKQTSPDPKVSPQGHVSRVRLEKYADASKEGISVVYGSENWVFPASNFLRNVPPDTLVNWAAPVGFAFSVNDKRPSAHIIIFPRQNTQMPQPNLALLGWFDQISAGQTISESSHLKYTKLSSSHSDRDPSGETSNLNLQLLVEATAANESLWSHSFYVVQLLKLPPTKAISSLPTMRNNISFETLSFKAEESQQLFIEQSIKLNEFGLSRFQAVHQLDIQIGLPLNLLLGRTLSIERYREESDYTKGNAPLLRVHGIISSNRLVTLFNSSESVATHKSIMRKSSPETAWSADTSSSASVVFVCQIHSTMEPGGYLKAADDSAGRIFFLTQRESAVSASVPYSWGSVTVVGEVCNDSGDLGTEISIISENGCCQDLKPALRPFYRISHKSCRFFEATVSAGNCFCGGGSRIQAVVMGKKYLCDLGFSESTATSVLAVYETVNTKVSLTSLDFTYKQRLQIFFIAGVAMVILLVPFFSRLSCDR